MLHDSTQQLIRKLHELTEAGALAWKEGERESSRLETEGYVIEIEASPPTLRLLRADGRELERTDAADLAATAWPGGDGTFATRVTEMATRANRIARGAEQAIAKILSSLSAPAKGPETARPNPPPEFGAAASFAKPVPHAEPPKPPSMLTGISARSVQAVEQPTPADIQRAIAPAAPPAPQPATGPNIYKPWN